MIKKTLFFLAFFLIALPAYAQTSNLPVISSVSVSSSFFQLGSPITMKWSKSGNFPTGDSYFVYLKDKSDQVLGSHNSVQGIHYADVVSWQLTLAYPAFTFGMPLVNPGTYYLEVDFVDPAGAVLATATSNSFEIKPLMVIINASTSSAISSSVQLSDLNPAQKQSIAMQLSAIINKVIQLVAELS